MAGTVDWLSRADYFFPRLPNLVEPKTEELA
jgi:hypothetical protein